MYYSIVGRTIAWCRVCAKIRQNTKARGSTDSADGVSTVKTTIVDGQRGICFIPFSAFSSLASLSGVVGSSFQFLAPVSED